MWLPRAAHSVLAIENSGRRENCEQVETRTILKKGRLPTTVSARNLS